MPKSWHLWLSSGASRIPPKPGGNSPNCLHHVSQRWRMIDVGRTVERDVDEFLLLQARLAKIGLQRDFERFAISASIITLPTHLILPVEMPSRWRFSLASIEGVSSRSAKASVTRRLISSGMVRSKLRNPASTCATFDAQLGAHQRACHGGVDISHHDHPIRVLPVGRLAQNFP